MWRRIVNVLMVLMLMAGSMVTLSGCKKKEPGPVEKAGQKIDKATKETGKAMEEAGKELQKSTE